MRLILGRHGQSWANVDPKYPDPDNAPLTDLGEKQADMMGQWLKNHETELDLILASPLKRARQTAEIANQHLKLPIEIHDSLREITSWDLPRLHIRSHPFQSETQTTPPGADDLYEKYCEQIKEALAVMTKDLKRPRPLLVVSHGGASATLLRLIFERHDMFFLTNNCALHFLEWRDARWVVRGLNFTAHLWPDLIS